MPLKITHRSANEVPIPTAAGKVNEDMIAVKNEMAKLATGMVLEIDAGSEKAVRSTKILVTKAANQLGMQWKHWSVGAKVFAKPAEATKRRGRPKKSA